MPKSVGDVIAERIRRFRQAKGWSVAELAAACEARGADALTQAVLTNVERPPGRSRGRRPVSVEELLTLADVLDVPPLSIVLPIGENVEIEIVPGRPPVSVTDALTWLTGSSSQGLDGKNPDDLSTWYALARLKEHIRVAQAAAGEAYLAEAHGTKAPTGPGTVRELLDWVRDAQAQHGEANPPLPEVLVEHPEPGGRDDG